MGPRYLMDCFPYVTLLKRGMTTEEIPKGKRSFLTRNSKRLFVSKAINLIGFVWLKN